jgi:D-alanine--poly(phosphoribitol) ligase subunit 2
VDQAELLAGIREIVFRRTGAVTDDRALVSSGLIDSMSIVDLILDLEQKFGIAIPPGDVQPDDFDTILRIAETVGRFS